MPQRVKEGLGLSRTLVIIRYVHTHPQSASRAFRSGIGPALPLRSCEVSLGGPQNVRWFL